MNNILITGGSGFIGRHLSAYLLSKHKTLKVHTPSKEELNLLDNRLVAEALKKYQPTTIIHLAGISNPSSEVGALGMTDLNVGGTQRLLQGALPDTRFIFASSIVVCGDSQYLKNEGNVQAPQSLYAATKAAAENMVSAYTALEKVRGISLRLCATIGSGLTHGVILDFIKKLQQPALYTMDIMGKEPGSYKPYLHINDVCRAFEAAIFNDVSGPINITNRDVLSIDNVADIVLDFYKQTRKKMWLGYTFPGDNLYLNYSNELAYQLLGWSPTISSSEAIYKTLEDIAILEHYS